MADLRPVYEKADDNLLVGKGNRIVYSPARARSEYFPIPVLSNWDEYLSNELFQLQNLEAGWDGYDSPPVDQHVAFFANNVLSRIANLGSGPIKFVYYVER